MTTTATTPLPLVRDLCPEAIGAEGVIQYCGPIRADWVYVPAGDRGYAIYESGRHNQAGRAGNCVAHIPAATDEEFAAELRRRIAAHRAAEAEAAAAEAARYAALPLAHVERQTNMTTAIIDRDDAGLAAWAVEWLGLDLTAVWPDLDDDQRDWLVSAGVVAEIEADAECTGAQSWQDDWRTESNAAWPTYDLEITADGMAPIEVTGWHLVGPMGPDGNRRHTEWDTEDGDGCCSGLPRVDEWDVEAGDNMSGGGLIPCWRQGDRWVTLDRDALDDAIRDAASESDHGGEPSWEDVPASDMGCDHTRYVIRDGAIEEIGLLTGGIAGHTTETWDEDDHYRRQVTSYHATAWAVENSDEVYESEEKAAQELRDLADDGKAYKSKEKAHLALSRIAFDAHDIPDGVEAGLDDAGLYVTAADVDEPYHLDDAQLATLIRAGWMSVADDVIDALGVRACIDLARRWQTEMDEIIRQSDPWVTLEDSTDAGNCRYGTGAFADQIRAAAGGREIGAARASYVLSLRDDRYTRRAVRLAAQRHVERSAVRG